MLENRIFIASHFPDTKKNIAEISSRMGYEMEEVSEIILSEDFIWIVDIDIWEKYAIENHMERSPWNFILLSEDKEDLKRNIIDLDNYNFLRHVLKYPAFLKYKKVLVVDDDMNQLKLIKKLLSYIGFIPYCIKDINNINIGLKTDPELILMDLYLSGIKADDLCREIKKNILYQEIPIIFISASEKREDMMGVLESGANDYIKKPFFLEELLARIGVQLRIRYMVDKVKSFLTSQEQLSKELLDLLEQSRLQKEQIKRMNKLLKKKSITDPLTQVCNRGYLFDILKREIARAKRYNEELVLIMFDIDHFKKINDTYGHIVGDDVLKKFVKIVRKRVRGSDLIGRYGGEEFIVLLTKTSLENAFKVAEDIRENIQKNNFKVNHNELSITVSGGVASFNQEESLNAFLVRLDQALYKAKENGRNQIQIAEVKK